MRNNSMSKLLALVLAIVLVSGFSSVSCQHVVTQEAKIGVVVTLLPQAEFVNGVGRDRVNVTVMVPPGADPHTYELTPSQLVRVSRAKMYAKVGSGVEFELTWMDKLIAQNKEMLVVDCANGVQLMQAVEDEHHEAEEGEHHTGNDPHIWLSPRSAKIMVENICHGLVKIDPDGAAYYAENKDAYLVKLDNLDKDMREGLAGVTNRRFIVFHPAWGYFARDYNLEQVPIEVGGKEPSAKDIANLVQEAKKYNIKVVFASPQFNPQSAQVIAQEIGGRVVFIDDLAGNYIDNMRMVLNELVEAME